MIQHIKRICILALIAILIANFSFSQSYKIFYTSDNFIKNSFTLTSPTSDSIAKINPGIQWTKMLKVKYTNGSERHIPKNETWGWQIKNEKYRYFNSESYSIHDTGRIYTYLKYSGKVLERYFSKDADSPIYKLTKKNLIHVLGNQEYADIRGKYKKWL